MILQMPTGLNHPEGGSLLQLYIMYTKITILVFSFTSIYYNKTPIISISVGLIIKTLSMI